LLICDGAISFMIAKLSAEKSLISQELLRNVNLYLGRGRLQIATEALKFLRDPCNSPCSGTIIRFLIKLLKRLKSEPCNESLTNSGDSVCGGEQQSDDTPQTSFVNEPQLSVSLEDELNIYLQNSTSSAVHKSSSHAQSAMEKQLRKEVDFYKETNNKGELLVCLENWLLTIKPTSIEPERSFSNAGIICIKIRSRLSDKTLDTLCFLRFFYQQQRNAYRKPDKSSC
jgi:hypothetical protein